MNLFLTFTIYILNQSRVGGEFCRFKCLQQIKLPINSTRVHRNHLKYLVWLWPYLDGMTADDLEACLGGEARVGKAPPSQY